MATNKKTRNYFRTVCVLMAESQIALFWAPGLIQKQNKWQEMIGVLP